MYLKRVSPLILADVEKLGEQIFKILNLIEIS